jgi:hypothetical protein
MSTHDIIYFTVATTLLLNSVLFIGYDSTKNNEIDASLLGKGLLAVIACFLWPILVPLAILALPFLIGHVWAKNNK